MRTNWQRLKKNAADVHGEVEKEIGRIVDHYIRERTGDGSFDLESFEMSIRSSMHTIGANMLETLITPMVVITPLPSPHKHL